MNRDDRKELKGLLVKYRDACDIIADVYQGIEGICNREQEKLDGLPEGLADSTMAQGIEESIGMLEEVMDALPDVQGDAGADCMASILGIRLPTGKQAPKKPEVASADTGEKTERLLIAISPSMLARAKWHAAMQVVSTSEFVRRALEKELEQLELDDENPSDLM